MRCLQDSGSTSRPYEAPDPSAFFSPAGDAIIARNQPLPASLASEPTPANQLSEAAVRVWDTKTGTLLRSVKPAATEFNLAVSPVGEVMAVGGSRSTRLYNWKTGELLRELFTGTMRVPFQTSMSFSPDGRWLGIASRANLNASIWDTSTGQEKWEFPVLDTSIDVKFSSDGRFVFTTVGNGTTAVWDFSTGKQVCALVSFTDGSWAVTDPDGRYDASNPDEAIGLHWVADTEVIELG